jgi:uncharacterized membrane protein YfcA
MLGAVLQYSAWRFLVEPAVASESRPLQRPVAIASGAGIGLLSGLTGTGGGIFLTPLLLVMGWAQPKNAAAVSALFILVNSLSGLLGNFASTRQLPAEIGVLLLVAVALTGDIAMGALLWRYMGIDCARPQVPHLMEWFEAIQEREPFRRAVMAVPRAKDLADWNRIEKETA